MGWTVSALRRRKFGAAKWLPGKDLRCKPRATGTWQLSTTHRPQTASWRKCHASGLCGWFYPPALIPGGPEKGVPIMCVMSGGRCLLVWVMVAPVPVLGQTAGGSPAEQANPKGEPDLARVREQVVK